MRFRVGFVMGCGAGYWAASKASQLLGLGIAPKGRGPRVVDSRADAVSAEKVRAISDLARARLGDLLDSPIGGVARDRVTELIGASLSGVGRPIDTTARWPR